MPLIASPAATTGRRVTLDAGHARDITLMLVDVHAASTTSTWTAPAADHPPGQDYLRE